jgi:hypothetical protein
LVSRGISEHTLAGAVAQYVLTETEVVMPAGQELEGMQKVSTVDAPASMVMLYHWSLAHEQETALGVIRYVSFIVYMLAIIWWGRETKGQNEEGK